MGSMEKWRKFFEGTGSDIFSVIDAAISVAAADCPHELRKRRDKIAHTLFTLSSCASANSSSFSLASSQVEDRTENGCSEEDHSGKLKEEDRSENAQDRKNSTKHVNCTNFPQRKADERSLREKMEASKRRLQKGYQQVEKAKKQRAIQIIELGDLPAQQYRRPISNSTRNRTLKTSNDRSP